MILSFLFVCIVAIAGGVGALPQGSTVEVPLRLLARSNASTAAGISLADLPLPAAGSFEPWLLNALLVISILGALFWAWNQGKDAIGRKPPVDEELAEFKKKVDDALKGMVTHAELERALETASSEIERKFEKALHDEFKQLNRERSTSIAGLHEKVERTTNELREQVARLSDEMPGKIIRLLKDTGHLE